MPVAPADEEEASDEKEADAGQKLNFSYVECLLYTFHQLGKQVGESISLCLSSVHLSAPFLFRLKNKYHHKT